MKDKDIRFFKIIAIIICLVICIGIGYFISNNYESKETRRQNASNELQNTLNARDKLNNN